MPVPGHLTTRSCWDMVKAHGCVNDSSEMWSIRQAFEQKNNELLRQYQAGEIEEALWKQEKELNKKYLEERLSDQQDYYAKADALRNNWNAGLGRD